jgi:hypothetical protein
MNAKSKFKLYRRLGDDILVKAKKIKDDTMSPVCNHIYEIYDAKTNEKLQSLPDSYFELMYKEDLGGVEFENTKYGNISFKDYIKIVFLKTYKNEKYFSNDLLFAFVKLGYTENLEESQKLIEEYVNDL